MLKLGDSSRLAFSTGDINLSSAFYESVGFRVMNDNEGSRTFTDGLLTICVSPGENNSRSMEYCSGDPDRVAELLRDLSLECEISEKENALQTIQFTGIKDININVLNSSFTSFPKSENTERVIDFWKRFEADPATELPLDIENPKLGFFTEFSQSIEDPFGAIKFWQKLGFEVITQQTEPYNWGTVTDGVNIFGFHESGSPGNPLAITYLARGMREKIEKLRSDGVNVKSDSEGSNFITSPEGMNFMLFDIDY